MEIFFAILILVVLIGIYVASYKLNQKTKPPKGCEIPEEFSSCSVCHSTSCLVKTKSKIGDDHD
ncbi:MAG: hypothetical protein WC088_00490 [Candidatus Izemoplasmatales bacterium]|jgi:hypothetical protein|nr:hypothetical protein [Candidatus Izemoplasmatales bacterium]